MSHPTKPAFIYDFPNGDFDETTRSHPALMWLERYLRDFLERQHWDKHHPHDLGHRPDSFIKTGCGSVVKGAEDHHKASEGLYKTYTDLYHVYDHIVVWETGDGWMSLGTAKFFFNTVDNGPRTVKSHDGRAWERVSPGGYRIHYRKTDSGEVQLDGVEIYNEAERIASS